LLPPDSYTEQWLLTHDAILAAIASQISSHQSSPGTRLETIASPACATPLGRGVWRDVRPRASGASDACRACLR
jgi:hypothetical protein